eukprot:450432-Pyramimonas_sp.AAC.1
MAGGSVAWRTRWLAMMQLGEDDDNVGLHETTCRVIETALRRDQTAICEPASFEHLARQM